MTRSGSVRVIIADDHPIVREGLQRLLEAEGFEVVGQAADGREALALLEGLEADVLLLDLSMPRLPGLDVLRGLSGRESAVRPIILTAAAMEPAHVLEAVKLGARGVVMKETATEMLFKAIRCVMDGGYWLGRETVADPAENAAGEPGNRSGSRRPFRLTTRELDITAAVVAGLANREIARKFSLSEQTVKHHLSNIFDKVGVSSRLELALFAIEHRLASKG
jgi:two-component system nitrate/nitrite response regulator NarL